MDFLYPFFIVEGKGIFQKTPQLSGEVRVNLRYFLLVVFAFLQQSKNLATQQLTAFLKSLLDTTLEQNNT